jgi:hypothetical protein
LRPEDTAVHLQWYFFRLTTREVGDYESGKVGTCWRIASGRSPSGGRFYKISEYAEPRMFRYRRAIAVAAPYEFPV